MGFVSFCHFVTEKMKFVNYMIPFSAKQTVYCISFIILLASDEQKILSKKDEDIGEDGMIS